MPDTRQQGEGSGAGGKAPAPKAGNGLASYLPLILVVVLTPIAAWVTLMVKTQMDKNVSSDKKEEFQADAKESESHPKLTPIVNGVFEIPTERSEKESAEVAIQPRPALESSPHSKVSVSNPDWFYKSSDGYSWRAASFELRRSYCAEVAAKAQKIKPGVTGTFIFDAVQEFYTTTDPNLLREPLFDIIAISTVAYR